VKQKVELQRGGRRTAGYSRKAKRDASD
jgi:hypothetical protein